MVGANYMGGKRSTARTKLKDVIGRAQRRHFGKQRLASALCATRESRARPDAPVLSSVLPEIALAHAHCDSDFSSSRKVFSGDQLYASTPSSDAPQHNKPSKVLWALDVSDHLSMRAAIHRILLQPNLVGINIPRADETAYIERTQTPVAVKEPTELHLDSEVPYSRHSAIGSTHVSNCLVSCPQTPEYGHTNLRETLIHKRTESIVISPSGPPSGVCDVTSQNILGNSKDAKVPSVRRVDPFFCTEDDEPHRAMPFFVYPLPRSSPLSSSSQSSDNSILDIDTSPHGFSRFRRSIDFSERSCDCVEASPLCSVRLPTVRRPSRNHAARRTSVSTDEGDLGAGPSRIVSSNNAYAFPSMETDDLRNIFQSGGHTIGVLMSQEDKKPGNISIDFLSDPHPWETIGRILEVGPQPSAAQSSMTLEICFTKDREGVGYVSREKPIPAAGSFDAISFEMRTGNKYTDNICAASNMNLPKLGTADLEIPTAGNCVETDPPDLFCAREFNPLSLCTSSPATRSEFDSCGHMHLRTEAPMPIHRMQHENVWTSSSLITAGITATAANVDTTFEGPCLFGESDFGEDD